MVKKAQKKPAKGKNEGKTPSKGPASPAKKADAEAVAVPKDPPATPKPADQPAKENSAAGVLWGLALLAIVIGGGYATLPLWKAYVPGLVEWLESGSRVADTSAEKKAISDVERERDALNAKLAVMIERLGSLEQQLGDVRKMVDATALPDEVAIANKSLQQLSGRLSKIEQSNETAGTVLDRLNRLEQDISDATAPPPEITTAIGEISKRLESLESGGDKNRRLSAKQSNAQALVLAVGQLRQILPTGAPYTLALQTLQRIGGDDSQITQAAGELAAHAATGVPSLKALSGDYTALAAEIAAATQNSEQGFFAQTLARLMSLVRISRVDGQADDPTSANALSDKAGQLLREGDLQGAVDFLQDLQDPTDQVQGWVRRAEIRLAAERALALLNVYAVSLLAPATE